MACLLVNEQIKEVMIVKMKKCIIERRRKNAKIRRRMEFLAQLFILSIMNLPRRI